MTRKKAVKAAVAATLSRETIGDAQALGSQNTRDAASQVADLLSQALKLAQEHGSVGWVTAWLDGRDEIEGYGYTVELKEQIEDLEGRLEDLQAVYPKGVPLDLSLVEQLQVEEFFRNFRDPSHRPAAGDRLEALLQRCRGFKVEQLEQVLQWMDSHALGELPFGPTDELRDQIREGKESLAKSLDTSEDLLAVLAFYQSGNLQSARMLLPQVVEQLKGLFQEQGRLPALRLRLEKLKERFPDDPDLAFFQANRAHIPLAALQWIVEQETAP